MHRERGPCVDCGGGHAPGSGCPAASRCRATLAGAESKHEGYMTDYRVNRWLDPDHDFGVQLDDTPEALAAKLYDDPWYWKHRPGLWTGMDEAAKAAEGHEMYR